MKKIIDTQIKECVLDIVESYHQILFIKRWRRDKFDKGWNKNGYHKLLFYDVIFENLYSKKSIFYLKLRELIGILKYRGNDKKKISRFAKYILELIQILYKNKKHETTNDLIDLLLKPMYDYISGFAHANSQMFEINPKSKNIIDTQNLNMEIEIYIFWKILCLIYQKIILDGDRKMYSYSFYISEISNILEIQKKSLLCKPKIVKLFEEIIKEESIEPFINPNIGIF